MIDKRLQIVEMAYKCARGDVCTNFGCFRRITEGTLCLECDKQRYDDEIDRIMEEITHETEEEEDGM